MQRKPDRQPRRYKKSNAFEQRVIDLLENVPDATLGVNQEGTIVLTNTLVRKLFGYEEKELLGQRVERLLPEHLRVKHARLRARYFRNPRARPMGMGLEFVGLRKDGTEFPAEISLSPLQTDGGWLALAAVRDVTERKRTQERVLASERLFRILVENVKDYAIFALDTNGVVASWSPGAETIMGYRAEEIIGQHFSRFYPEEGQKQGKPELELKTAKSVGRFEELGWRVRKDGSRFWANVVVTPQRDSGGRLIGFSKITHDLTERKAIDDKLRQSEEKFSKAFQSTPLSVTISTVADGRYIDVNDAFLRLVGQERGEVIGHRSTASNLWAYPEDRVKLLEDLDKHKRVVGFETVFNSKMDSARNVRIFAEPIELDGIPCVVAVTEDITDAKIRETQFRQAQKMEATGRLAGGIAHDFNNILNVILGYCQLLLDRVTQADPSRQQVKQIEAAAKRASDLTRQLLAFGRQQVLQSKVVDLNRTLVEMGDMLRRLIGEDIEVSFSLAESLWPIDVDPTQMVQIVMNLAVNARDAMPSGGKLTIETANVKLNGEYIKTHLKVAPGNYVRLVVTDTGIGMDEETSQHIFEPFFTTKELGKGTGLGLATVYGIVKQSEGYIWVYSEPGRGTAFKIYLPRCEGSAAEELEVAPTITDVGGTETILVLEDNDELRELAVAFLESKGYSVLETGDPEQALELARAHQGPIHLLLTDVVMPKITGRTVAEKLAVLHPESKVVFVSGYTDDVIVRHGILNENVPFLQKPYSREGLTAKIRSVLDGES